MKINYALEIFIVIEWVLLLAFVVYKLFTVEDDLGPWQFMGAVSGANLFLQGVTLRRRVLLAREP